MWFGGGSRNGGADVGGVWGGGIPFPMGVGSGEEAVPPPQKKILYFFSFEMVHFDAFWNTMEVNCVTTTFSGCTCSTFQQKGRPKIFCADFSGGGFQPPKPPSDYGPVQKWLLKCCPLLCWWLTTVHVVCQSNHVCITGNDTNYCISVILLVAILFVVLLLYVLCKSSYDGCIIVCVCPSVC